MSMVQVHPITSFRRRINKKLGFIEEYNSIVLPTSFNTKEGYYYFCNSKHPLITNKSKSASLVVYLHRHLASFKLGRWLFKNEVVHHKDENKLNNNLDNLEVLSVSLHSYIHSRLKCGEIKKAQCKNCNNLFIVKKKKKLFCSKACCIQFQSKWEISKSMLEKLVWEIPTETIGKRFNISGKAVEKKCKRWNIKKPPRGYWAKINAKTKDI